MTAEGMEGKGVPGYLGLFTEVQFCLPAQIGTLSSAHRHVKTIIIFIVTLSATEHVLCTHLF